MSQSEEKISEGISNFIGKKIELTTILVISHGLDMIENASLFVLKSTARSKQLKGFAHSRATEFFHVFNEVRKTSSIIPFMAGSISRRSTLLGFKIGFKALNLSKKHY